MDRTSRDEGQLQQNNFVAGGDGLTPDLVNDRPLGGPGDKPKQPGKSPKMSPQVLEVWLKDTLQDAEHLEIPGVLLKAE